MNNILGTQLWIKRGNLPLEEKFFHDVSNEGSFGRMGVKAYGGLWTSSFLGKGVGSEWIQWSLGESFDCPEDYKWEGYLLEIKEETRIYTVDSLTDMHILFDKYGYQLFPVISQEGIDFEKMSEDFDAIHLTSKGQELTRHGFSFYEPEEVLKEEWKEKRHRNLYGWDCESTFHFKWNFESVKPVSINVSLESSQEIN